MRSDDENALAGAIPRGIECSSSPPISALIDELDQPDVAQLLQFAAERLVRGGSGRTRFINDGAKLGIDQRLPRKYRRARHGDVAAHGIHHRFGPTSTGHQLPPLFDLAS